MNGGARDWPPDLDGALARVELLEARLDRYEAVLGRDQRRTLIRLIAEASIDQGAPDYYDRRAAARIISTLYRHGYRIVMGKD